MSFTVLGLDLYQPGFECPYRLIGEKQFFSEGLQILHNNSWFSDLSQFRLMEGITLDLVCNV